MSHLEEDLRMALRRKEPPPDFAGRVMARVQGRKPAPRRGWWEALAVLIQPPRIQWVALSLVISILVPAVSVHYHREQRLRAEGERAKEQLLFAVRVTGNKLQHVRKRVLEIGRMDTRL
ncbi:MAG TPA: hypothetical protein VLX58_03605 [Bryobacteraceae bacterium]|nr:hypothetical protein [Bryobacteraceae bacterium]